MAQAASAGLSLRKPGFNPRPDHVRFVVDKVASGRVSLLVCRFSPFGVVPPVLHVHSFIHSLIH